MTHLIIFHIILFLSPTLHQGKSTNGRNMPILWSDFVIFDIYPCQENTHASALTYTHTHRSYHLGHEIDSPGVTHPEIRNDKRFAQTTSARLTPHLSHLLFSLLLFSERSFRSFRNSTFLPTFWSGSRGFLQASRLPGAALSASVVGGLQQRRPCCLPHFFLILFFVSSSFLVSMTYLPLRNIL